MTSQAQAFVNPCPSCPGHVCMRNLRNERIDSMSGPRDFMIRAYLANGFRVYDEVGRELGFGAA